MTPTKLTLTIGLQHRATKRLSATLILSMLPCFSMGTLAGEPNNSSGSLVLTHAPTLTLNADVYPAQYQSQIIKEGQPLSNYCTATLEDKTSHPDNVNSLRRDIDCMMTELRGFISDKQGEQNSPQRYYAYKAMAWLNYAYHEDVEGSLTAAREVALAEGLSILQALRTGQTDKLLMNTDIPATSAMMRPDLWAKLMALKHHDGIKSAPRTLAFAEVKLIWAASEQCEFGWRHSTEHFGSAERWLNEAEERFVNAHTDQENLTYQATKVTLFNAYQPLDATTDVCRGQVIPSLPKPSVSLAMPDVQVDYVIEQAPEITPPPVIKIEPFVVHFALDKSELTPRSQQILDDAVATIRRLNQEFGTSGQDAVSISLYGHTDKRASATYNLALSKRRTQSVATYLRQQGLQSVLINQYPEGQFDLLTEQEDVTSHALNRRVEVVLVPNPKLSDSFVIEQQPLLDNHLKDASIQSDLVLE